MSLWDAFRGAWSYVVPPPKPETWEPTFYADVKIFMGGKVIGTVTDEYCATEETAQRLVKILADLGPVVVYGQPFKFAPDSPSFASEPVPWIKFADGKLMNAGLLANSWVVTGGGLKAGEEYCRKMIALEGK